MGEPSQPTECSYLDLVQINYTHELIPNSFIIPLAAIIPVAAAPVIDPETPAPSPAT